MNKTLAVCVSSVYCALLYSRGPSRIAFPFTREGIWIASLFGLYCVFKLPYLASQSGWSGSTRVITPAWPQEPALLTKERTGPPDWLLGGCYWFVWMPRLLSGARTLLSTQTPAQSVYFRLDTMSPCGRLKAWFLFSFTGWEVAVFFVVVGFFLGGEDMAWLLVCCYLQSVSTPA